MPTEDKPAPGPKLAPKPKPAIVPPTKEALAAADNHHSFREDLIRAVLPEIVAWQLAGGRAGQEAVAASMACRYADRTLEAMKTVSKATMAVRGMMPIAPEIPATPPMPDPIQITDEPENRPPDTEGNPGPNLGPTMV